MQAFSRLDGLVAPLDRANVDTDAIIPKQFLKSIKRTGFGVNLFDEWRYLDHGEPGQDCAQRPRNSSFVLNQARYQGAQILLTRANFGCGSSREHAVWALLDFGIRCLIAPNFADIFYSNCISNGLLPITLMAAEVEGLFNEVAEKPHYRLQVDLPLQSVTTPPQGHPLYFAIDPAAKNRLLKGLDDIGLTLEQAEKIKAFELRRRQEAPWLFLDV
ncbi:MAG: 3-isopropylmalate dehydratase small subunit [Gammaproteobacteria bacterium]